MVPLQVVVVFLILMGFQKVFTFHLLHSLLLSLICAFIMHCLCDSNMTTRVRELTVETGFG